MRRPWMLKRRLPSTPPPYHERAHTCTMSCTALQRSSSASASVRGSRRAATWARVRGVSASATVVMWLGPIPRVGSRPPPWYHTLDRTAAAAAAAAPRTRTVLRPARPCASHHTLCMQYTAFCDRYGYERTPVPHKLHEWHSALQVLHDLLHKHHSSGFFCVIMHVLLCQRLHQGGACDLDRSMHGCRALKTAISDSAFEQGGIHCGLRACAPHWQRLSVPVTCR